MRRSLSLFLFAGLVFASAVANATPTPSSNMSAPATTDTTVDLVPYSVEVTRPNEVPQSATLLTAADTPVEFNLTRSVSYIKEACRVTKTKPEAKTATGPKDIAPTPVATAAPSSACDKVDTSALPIGAEQVIFTPGVVTSGVQLTLTRITDGEHDSLRVKVSNISLLSIRNFTYDTAMVQLPTTSEKNSDQFYPVVPNSALVLDIGDGARVVINRVTMDGSPTRPFTQGNALLERSLFDLPQNTRIQTTDRGNDQVQINRVSHTSLDSIQSATFDGDSVQLPTLSEKSYDQVVPLVQTVPSSKIEADCQGKGTLTGGGYALLAWSGKGSNAPESSYPLGQSWVVADSQHVNDFTAYAICSSL